MEVHAVSQTAEGHADEGMLVGEVGGASAKTQALGGVKKNVCQCVSAAW